MPGEATPRLEAITGLVSSHEERIQDLERTTRTLESTVATTAAVLQAMSIQVASSNRNVCEKIDDVKEYLTEKVSAISREVASINKKTAKEDDSWKSMWQRLVLYFLTSGVAGAVSLAVHEFIIRPNIVK